MLNHTGVWATAIVFESINARLVHCLDSSFNGWD
jgi:hypothetical protein